MRSEKEIRDNFRPTSSDETCLLSENNRGWNLALNWVLKGKPRYSVAELEKIIKKEFGGYFGSTNLVVKWNEMEKQFTYLLEILKDKKQVEKILR